MPTLVKLLQNNRKVTFDRGKFDDWCVYIEEENGTKNAPLDVQYFAEVQNIAENYPNSKVYHDFVSIYDSTTQSVNVETIELINKTVSTYKNEHQTIIEQWFTVIYAGMIAEENKQFAVLKKRIKRLGMYQILVQKIEPLEAANFSKGKKWRELDAIMQPYGF